MSELVVNAIAYATQAHRRINQLRRYSGQPYEVHLKAVAEIVESVSDDPEMIAAAWLHDVVEDTPATVEDVERAFGKNVAALVLELTDLSRPGHGNRSARMKVYREHLASSSMRAKTIKLADLIDNCRDITRHDRKFAPTYLAEMAAFLEVLQEGDPRLYRRARKVLVESSERLGLGRAEPSREDPGGMLTDLDRDLAQRHARTIEIFARSFHAEDIAEPLRTPEAERPDPHRPIGRDQIVEPEASLTDVIEVLTKFDNCFVGTGGKLIGVIERADVQKPVARMWLFGIITIIEMYFTRRIKTLWPDGSWEKLLTPRRLDTARALRSERLRRDQRCELIDCLQITDKGEILLQNPMQLAAFGFETRGAGKRVMKEIGSLRNNLAHAQDIVVYDWPQIVRLARRVEGMYRLTA